MSTPATYYLRCVALFSAFRVVIYIINLELVTRVKISKADWENLRIRELAYTWTKQIQNLMTFRTLVFGLGSFLRNREERNVLALLSFCTDLQIMFVIYRVYYVKSAKTANSVLVHENAIPPTLIQGAHIAAFFVACYFEYFNEDAAM